jgi:hypothetical protein
MSVYAPDEAKLRHAYAEFVHGLADARRMFQQVVHTNRNGRLEEKLSILAHRIERLEDLCLHVAIALGAVDAPPPHSAREAK